MESALKRNISGAYTTRNTMLKYGAFFKAQGAMNTSNRSDRWGTLQHCLTILQLFDFRPFDSVTFRLLHSSLTTYLSLLISFFSSSPLLIFASSLHLSLAPSIRLFFTLRLSTLRLFDLFTPHPLITSSHSSKSLYLLL